MRVVGVAADQGGLRELVGSVPAEAIVTECLPYSREGAAAFAAIETIRQVAPALKILALDCRTGAEQFSLALRAGADGFLSRDAEPADVVTALRCIRRGETYVAPALVTRMVNQYVLRSPEHSLEDAYDTLTDREHEVLLLAAVGHTNREIARALHLSEQTVHNYRATVMEKLGFHDRVELLKFAIRRGVLNVADL
jgi:two-component system response regulator NreC